MICEGRQFEPGREQGSFFSSFIPKNLLLFSSCTKHSLELPLRKKEKKKKKKGSVTYIKRPNSYLGV